MRRQLPGAWGSQPVRVEVAYAHPIQPVGVFQTRQLGAEVRREVVGRHVPGADVGQLFQLAIGQGRHEERPPLFHPPGRALAVQWIAPVVQPAHIVNRRRPAHDRHVNRLPGRDHGLPDLLCPDQDARRVGQAVDAVGVMPVPSGLRAEGIQRVRAHIAPGRP